MTELALTKKQRMKKNAGGGKPLPLRRSYAREHIEQKTRGANEVKNLNERMDQLERKLDADELRLSAERDARIAGEVDAKAQRLMGADPTLDYSTATRMVLDQDERFARNEPDNEQDNDLASAIERRMKADPDHYDNDDEGDGPVGSVHAMSDAEYEQQVKEAMQARGYEV